MEMIIEIYKNNEKVNEIQSTDPAEIYKKIAQIYKAKHDKTASRTIIQTSWGTIHEATEIYNQDKTHLNGTKYKYQYYFKNITL